MPSVRHALVTAVLGCAALTLTACQPDDDGAADGVTPPAATASRTAGAPAASASPSTKSACPTLAPGHKYVLVESVSGAMNTLTTKDAKQNCNPDEGAFYDADKGKEHEYLVESDDTPITVLHLKEKGPAKMTARNGGLEHIRICVNGYAQETATKKADTSDCYGENFFDVAVGSDGKITEMTELYGS
ncbi:hypothetical protein [Streptomyces sp. NK08204]|uniref:hypothetical protein n=1 Tax=Streptomyces sp. NK08204 TaxID=2873260 RepID=UPI001CECC33D|nr:hypothetical protein [Streptomyces sp. NK08204]